METAVLIEPWLYSTLSGDSLINTNTGGQIYGETFPDEVSGLYITFALLSSRDIRGVGVHRIQTDNIYAVKAIRETTSKDDLLPTVNRFMSLLDGKSVTVPGVGSLTCARETIISYSQVISDSGQIRAGGQVFLHLGGTFRIVATLS